MGFVFLYLSHLTCAVSRFIHVLTTSQPTMSNYDRGSVLSHCAYLAHEYLYMYKYITCTHLTHLLQTYIDPISCLLCINAAIIMGVQVSSCQTGFFSCGYVAAVDHMAIYFNVFGETFHSVFVL